MPEGHLLHRTACELTADLAGSVVAASSPQGRFEAARVDGSTVALAEAYGKHLMVHLEDAPTVHVHLGMRGLFLRYPDPSVPPKGGVRLRLAGPVAWDLIAPTTCELLDGAGVARVVRGLGPDPLRDDATTEEAVARLLAARGPVAAAIVDQSVWAGVGNAWRAELLFLARLDPTTPAHTAWSTITAATGPRPARSRRSASSGSASARSGSGPSLARTRATPAASSSSQVVGATRSQATGPARRSRTPFFGGAAGSG